MHERLKLLLWRIVCKSLSVWEILSKRFPIPNISCPVCGEEVETVEHIFIRCPITVQAWANSVWPLNMVVFKDMNIDQWIKIIINSTEMLKIQGKEAKEFTLFVAVLCDQIWKNRNQTVWGNQPIDSIKLSLQINKVFIQHKQAWQSILGEKENPPSWKPPPLGWIKCNFDAVVKLDKVVLVVVCRDSNGSIVAVESQEECPGEPLWAESKAALLAATLARREGFARVVLEGDAQSVIKAILKPSTTPHWSIKAIIEDIRTTLNSFVCWNASFVFRDSNVVAHSLAQ
nr:uncharacterized protein LOC112000408 [Quercus suber]